MPLLLLNYFAWFNTYLVSKKAVSAKEWENSRKNFKGDKKVYVILIFLVSGGSTKKYIDPISITDKLYFVIKLSVT